MINTPTWYIPMELVTALAGPAETARLVDLRIKRDARFQPHAQLTLNEQGFIAVCSYAEFGRQGEAARHELAVKLGAVPHENAR